MYCLSAASRLKAKVLVRSSRFWTETTQRERFSIEAMDLLQLVEEQGLGLIV